LYSREKHLPTLKQLQQVILKRLNKKKSSSKVSMLKQDRSIRAHKKTLTNLLRTVNLLLSTLIRINLML